MSEQTYLDELDEERRHNLAASEQQLDLERDKRIKAFAAREPEIAEWIDEGMSHILIQAHIKLTGLPHDEYRTYKVIAEERDAIIGDASRWRILLEDVENGTRHLLTATSTLTAIESAEYDVDSVCRLDIFDDLVQLNLRAPKKSYIGCLISLRTIDGVPTLPMPPAKYKMQLRKSVEG